LTKRRKKILIWFFTWAGLLVAVLYSPLGSPDLYKSSSNCSVANQNVDFNGGAIENDQNISFESGNDYNELNVPDYSSDGSSSKSSSANYSYAASTGANISSNATSYASSESQSYQNLKNGSSGGMGAGGGSFASNESSGAVASSAVTMTSGGITTLSALTMNLSNKTNQYTPASGGQNPGGDPEAGTRIPVPDGWGFLLLLAASYGIIKKKFFTA
jgi:hypothetical protein